MSGSSEPEAVLDPLKNADGSATFSFAGYTVVGAVNGPIEVQRRDELPEEAAIDVVVRPSSGVGSTRERHLESLLQSTLRQVILINNFPRTLIQVILQITNAPENDYVNAKVIQASSNLSIIPALIQTAILSLLSAAIPLTATLTSVALALIPEDGTKRLAVNPSAREVEVAESLHVFAFTSHDEPILMESEGEFTMQEWNRLYEAAQQHCCSPSNREGADTVMDEDSDRKTDMRGFVRSALESKIATDLYWK